MHRRTTTQSTEFGSGGERLPSQSNASAQLLADKSRLRVGLDAINFFPRAFYKRPSASLTEDCRHARIIAIIRIVHFGLKA